jgi:hypothetical protein
MINVTNWSLNLRIEQLNLSVELDFNYTGEFKESDELLILCFFQKDHELVQNLLNKIQSQFPLAKITGCSGAGELIGDEIFDDKLIVNLIKFKKSNQFKIIKSEIGQLSSFKAGEYLGESLSVIDNTNGVIFFSDGLNVDGVKFSEGLNSSLKKTIPIVGGLAGDGVNFKKTYIIDNGIITSNIIITIVLLNSVSMAVSANGGWNRFGFEHIITKAENNIVYEIDNRPALDFYKEHLGNESSKLPASGLHFPLTVLNYNQDGVVSDDLVRTLLAIDEEKKSLTFAGSIPTNSRVDLMKSTDKNLINSSHKNLNNLKDKIPTLNQACEGNLFSLIISCVGRRLAIGQRIEEELLSFNEIENMAQSGFYSYGELSSNENSVCSLFNQTLTQAIFWEREDE